MYNLCFVAAFTLRRQSGVLAAGTLWLTNPKILPIRVFTENICWALRSSIEILSWIFWFSLQKGEEKERKTVWEVFMNYVEKWLPAMPPTFCWPGLSHIAKTAAREAEKFSLPEAQEENIQQFSTDWRCPRVFHSLYPLCSSKQLLSTANSLQRSHLKT